MSRKSIILSLIALALMLIGVGVAVLYLYSDTEQPARSERRRLTDDNRHAVLSAVPSDAALVACFKEASEVAPEFIDALECPDGMKRSAMAVSLHFSGKLLPLYIFEYPGDEEVAAIFKERLAAKGMKVDVWESSLIVSSVSETLVKSSMRHLDKKVSVLDASGFDKALSKVDGDDALFISHAHLGKLLPSVVTRKYTRYSEFLSRFSDWTAFAINASESGVSLKGKPVYDSEAAEFITVLEKSAPSVSSVASVLPSYTLFAMSIPMKDHGPYVEAYRSYLDTRQRLQTNLALRQSLAKKYGVQPQVLMEGLDVREVAVADFIAGNSIEKISLIKVGNRDAVYVDSVSYSAVSAAMFGDMFGCGEDAVSVFIDGWIISGSRSVIDEYRSGKTLEYTLADYMKDCASVDILSVKDAAMTAYFSFTQDRAYLKNIFSSSFLKRFGGLYDEAQVAPAVFSLVHGKDGLTLALDVLNLSMEKTNESVYERDTTVVVPKGPFKVKNSGTGKMNEFYQNSHLSLCLREEGKDLWGVPFDKPLCGTAQTVDFYANGKLQILFGAGSRIYLIDRLGRYVNGFPLDLRKDILLGPDVYDFTGKKKYNIMVLHKDNTIAMYNLQGVKPSSWKDITVKEGRIKSLPERIDLGGSTFWIVRTSVQTLIYPFYGGDPLTVFEGERRIRPDSGVKAVDGTTVEFTCYDGKVRTMALK